MVSKQSVVDRYVTEITVVSCPDSRVAGAQWL